MQAGLHAASWTLQRLAIGLGAAVALVFTGYVLLVIAIVVRQAISGQ